MTKDVFISACEAVGSPFSQTMLHLAQKGQDRMIAEAPMPRPENYSNHEAFANDYCLYTYLSKWKGLDTGIDTAAKAEESFHKAEALCRQTNERLSSACTSFVDPVIHRAQRLIAKLLGKCHRSKLEPFEDWGPGATTDLQRSAAYPDTKLVDLPIPVTESCFSLFKSAIERDLHWSESILGTQPWGPYTLLKSCLVVIPGSTIDTVPKNAKTDRTIAIEPRGNMFLQKGVGGYIRHRLKRVGIDLNKQEINQELAQKAYIQGYATIDLSMASDTMSLALVRELLPFDWFVLLDCLRSRSYQIRGSQEYRLFEKFSSMGNGFTFELESLIFWALAKASQDDESVVSVYGDDIICEQSQSAFVITALNWAGFSVNSDKSFVEGSFFESCGRHYFEGVDVTPIYQKEVVTDLQGAIRAANRVARFFLRRYGENALTSPWFIPWTAMVHPLLGERTPYLPFGSEGDDGLLVYALLYTPERYDRNRGYRFSTIVNNEVTIPGNDVAMLALAFRRSIVVERPSYGMLPSRSSESKPSLRTAARWIEPSWEYYLT